MTNKQTFPADNLSFLSTRRGLSLMALAENTGTDPSTAYRPADPANSRQPGPEPCEARQTASMSSLLTCLKRICETRLLQNPIRRVCLAKSCPHVKALH